MTQPHRDTWRVEMVEQESRGGLLHFEYVIREGAGEPWLLNNHRMQARETHQRVVPGPNGGYMHVSGVEVLPRNLDSFLSSDQRAYRWVDRDVAGRWRDNRGRVLAPYIFARAAWCGGGDEELDPQWQRETYTLPLAGQVDEALERYQRRAERRGYVGDRRGTTLNLQVGASADDARELDPGVVSITATSFTHDVTTDYIGCRWQNVTIPAGATIDDAIYSIYLTSGTGGDEPGVRLHFEDVDDVAAYTAGTNFNISGRARTTAFVDWNDTDLGSAGGTFEEFGCTATGGAGLTVETPLQEVIDRAGWASGQDIGVLILGLGIGATRDLEVDFYDANSARGAKLDIDYTASGGGAVIKDIIGGGFLVFPR